MDFAITSGAAENKIKWKVIVAKSSVLPHLDRIEK